MPKQRFGCIYRLTNEVTGRKYIGQTLNFKQRMSHHRSDALNMKSKRRKSYLMNSICKHGWENFKQEILIDDVPEEDLSNLEISYIAVENTMVPHGYNMTIGGEGGSGYKHTPENAEKSRRLLAYYRKIRTFNVKPRIVFRKKKWRVEIRKNKKNATIGMYRTKEKAEKAIKLYEKNGKCLPSDRDVRKRGTGGVHYLHPTGWKAQYKSTHIGYYETELDAQNAVSIYIKTGKKSMSWNQRRKLKKKRGLCFNYIPRSTHPKKKKSVRKTSRVPVEYDHECHYCRWRGTCTEVEEHIKTCWKRDGSFNPSVI